jgi:protease IV
VETVKRLTLAVGLTLLTSLTSRAHAQDVAHRPPKITPPGRSLAGTDDTDALALNPSQLAFMPSWELRYTRVQLPAASSSQSPMHGDAVGLGFPLFFGFSTGFRFESMRPRESSPLPAVQTWAWSLAFKVSDALSYAFDIRHWRPSDDVLSNATTFGLSSSMRLSRHLGFAFVARDLTGARGDILGIGHGIGRSFDFGFAIRPLATRAFEIGLEATLWPGAPKGDVWAPRGTLGFDVPKIGRLAGSFQANDPIGNGAFKNSWTATAGLEIGLYKSRLGGGAIFGQGLDAGGRPGWYATASVAGFTQPGVPETDRGVTIRIEDTPGAKGHVRLLRKLARLGRDPTVKGIALVLKAEPASSTAHAEELADAFTALRAKGIKILCHLEDGGGRGLLACSAADKILVHPAGGLRFAGLRSQTMYFGEALHKIGIEPDFIRIKEHKSAPEAFVRDGPTPVASKDQDEFIAAIEGVYLDRISKGRRIPRDVVKANIAKGPFVADEAITAGFIDGKAFDDELNRELRAVIGKVVRIEEDEPPDTAPESFGRAPRIAVVYLDGDIVDGRSQKVPLLGTRLVGSYTLRDTLEKVKNDPNIKGVVFRIESPGGSSLASDVIWREAELLAKVKPVVVSMGSVAASGGYYSAAFGAPIYANASTVTGSIGIFYGKADISPLLSKLGIHVVTKKTAPKADAESLYRAFTDDERIELGKKVAQFYAVFLDRVARGRGWTIDKVDAVGHGKVWTGAQAKDVGLIDHVGGFDAALEAIRLKCGLPPDAAVVELPSDKGGLLDLVLDAFGVVDNTPQVAALPKALAPYADAIAPFAVYAPDQPLALFEGFGMP